MKKMRAVVLTVVLAICCSAFGSQNVSAQSGDAFSEEELLTIFNSFTETQIFDAMVAAGAIYNQRYNQTINPFAMTFSSYNQRSRQNALAGPAWGIKNKEELEDTLYWILMEGHSDVYMLVAQELLSLSDAEYSVFLSQLDSEQKNIITLIKDIYNEYGDNGIVAWDMYRAALLVMWGYEADYFTKEECLEWGRPIAFALKVSFDNWDQAHRNYLLGYCFWGHIDPNEAGSEYQLRINACETIKKDKPELFNDAFFQLPAPTK